jgi:hypothetical protein
VDNAGDTAVVTRLRLIPLDASAHVLRGVKVTTLFGTDRERAVIPRGSTYDILRFSGPGFRRVRRVRVAVTALKAVDFPPARQAVVERHLFTVRILMIGWERPPPGAPRQAAEVTPLGGLIRLPAKGTATIPLPPRLRGRIVVSAKPYFAR